MIIVMRIFLLKELKQSQARQPQGQLEAQSNGDKKVISNNCAPFNEIIWKLMAVL